MTVAPGTARPCVSISLPVRVPVVSCAEATPVSNQQSHDDGAHAYAHALCCSQEMNRTERAFYGKSMPVETPVFSTSYVRYTARRRSVPDGIPNSGTNRYLLLDPARVITSANRGRSTGIVDERQGNPRLLGPNRWRRTGQNRVRTQNLNNRLI